MKITYITLKPLCKICLDEQVNFHITRVWIMTAKLMSEPTVMFNE